MKNNNLKIAEEYSKRMKTMVDKCWVSDNLPELSPGDRKAILKVYRKHFHTVDYDPATGICKCWVEAPSTVDFSDDNNIEFKTIDIATGISGSDIKESTRDLLGMKEPDARHIWIENSDEFESAKH
jgi:hypothetical protein